jgi:phosphoribosylglycinamide formyltransferase-1
MVMRVGVLASGRGSNLQALLRAFPQGHPSVRIACLVSNRPECAALGHATKARIPALTFPRTAYQDRTAQQEAMATALTAAGVELVVLAGYDQVLLDALLRPFAGRIINIHPSLLPAFSGTLHAQAEALAYGVKVSGCTVHYVNGEIDRGPIIAQAAVPVYESDTVQSLADRILEQEHRVLPAVVQCIAEGRVTVEGRRVLVAEGVASAGITERL